MSETTSDETSEPETDEETDEGSESEPEPESEGDDQELEASSDDEDEAWKNFQKKFGHFKSERDRKAAMGRAFWEKTNYASKVRKENESLKAELAQLKHQPAREEKPPEPSQPPPELARIEQRIQVLVQKDNSYQAQQNTALQQLSAADGDLRVIEDRLKTTDDDYQKAILEQRLETAKIKRESLLQRWADLNDKREGVSLEMEQRLSDRDWTQKFLQDKATRENAERQSLESFNVEFPKHVDALITSSADALGAPPDQKIRRGLWKSVNRAMMVDLWQLGDEGLQQVDVPGLVRAHVKEYLEERDLVGRTKFAKTSTEKLRASGRPAARAAAPPPASSKRPVPVAHLSTSDTTPSMLRARRLLQQRLGGGR